MVGGWNKLISNRTMFEVKIMFMTDALDGQGLEHYINIESPHS